MKECRVPRCRDAGIVDRKLAVVTLERGAGTLIV